ncbi:MAG: PP2C family protein-serine/threonine phosphatase [Chloroflexi bacterium]|nr:PP2C family protein-serine/threonine phosphatase [Chloroflexota bacterium]
MSSEQIVRQIASIWARELTALAQAWQQAGAGCLALVDQAAPGRPLFVHPAHTPTDAWAQSVPIPSRRFPGMRLCIGRLPAGAAEVWSEVLNANARMIAGFFEREYELEALTAEVVNYQDLVLALYELNNALSRPLSVPQMLGTVLEHICHLTSATGGAAVVRHPMELIHRVKAGLSDEALNVLFETVTQTGGRVADAREDGQSVLCLPLFTPERHGNVDAVMVLLSDTPLRSPEIKLAVAIVQQSGVHLENIIHFEKRVAQARIQTEIELARTMQMRLLPRKPVQLPGIQMCGASNAAHDVGGDFFDYIATPGAPFVFALGDVSGKGLPAALVMTMTRTAIRSAAAVRPEPVSILSRVNEDLYDDFTELDKLTTAFVGTIGAGGCAITYANAGHSPIVYTAPDETAHMLEADAPPLGVLPLYLGDSHTLEFAPGGVLIVATDGFVEAENEAGEMFGYTRFMDLIDSVKAMSAEAIMQALFESVIAFRGSVPQGDDQTMVVIKSIDPAAG